MLQIGYLIICEDVIREKNHSIIQKPLPVINPINIPGNFTFKVAFSMFEDIDNPMADQKQTLNVIITDPKNNEIFNSGQLFIEANYNQDSEDKRIRVAEADMGITNLELKHKGIHTITLTLNDNTKTLDFPVILKEELDD